MKLKPNYLLIPGIAIATFITKMLLTYATQAWSWFTTELVFPEVFPTHHTFVVAWSTIFILTAGAALIVWNGFVRNGIFWAIMGLFCSNVMLNILWSYLFFTHHLIGAALINMILLEIVTIVLMLLISSRSFITAALLGPYILWGGFGLYLNFLFCVIS